MMQKKWPRRIALTAGIVIIFTLLYLLGTSWAAHLYTPEWTTRNMLLPCVTFFAMLALLGVSGGAIGGTLGYALGVGLGEWIGMPMYTRAMEAFELSQAAGEPINSFPQHRGWFIWGITMLIGLVLGIAVDLVFRWRKRPQDTEESG